MASALAMMLIPIATICTGSNPHPKKRAEMPLGFKCVGLSIPIYTIPADSVSSEERCRLAKRAFYALSRAKALSGLSPSDTGDVYQATITPLTQNGLNGALDVPSWHITLALRRHPYDAEVIIYRRSDSVAVSRIHKPLGQ